jgi:hypothetical protein
MDNLPTLHPDYENVPESELPGARLLADIQYYDERSAQSLRDMVANWRSMSKAEYLACAAAL